MKNESFVIRLFILFNNLSPFILFKSKYSILIHSIPLTSVTLNIINQRISEVLTQRVQTNLSLDVLDELMKSIYTIEMDRCATQWFQTLPSEEVSIVYQYDYMMIRII